MNEKKSSSPSMTPAPNPEERPEARQPVPPFIEKESLGGETEAAVNRIQALNKELVELNAVLEAKVAELCVAAERERQELQTLLESLPVGVAIAHDARCQHITGNSVIYQMLGLTPQTNLSLTTASPQTHNYRIFQHGRELAYHELPIQRALAEGIELRDQEYQVLLADGSEKILFGHVSPFFDSTGQVRGGLAVFMDITGQKHVEHELRELTQSLEQRVAERTSQLRTLAMMLTTAEQRERRRVADLIHGELQQLLTAAMMKLHLLKTAHGSGEQAEKLHDEIEQLLRQAINQARYITMQLSPPILQYSGLPAALEWLADWMKTAHGLTVATNIDGVADPASEQLRAFLFEAVRELLFNVVKHAQVDQAKLELQLINDEQCRLRVTDEGVGCESQRWQQPDQNSEKFGLFSIKDRLDLLGCIVYFDSAPGKGFCAEIIAPMGSREEQAAQQQAGGPLERFVHAGKTDMEEKSDLDGLVRILVVDDHSIVREGIITLLERQSELTVVGEAADGHEAIDQTRQLHPDVVMMDVNMPGMNGIQATRIIKEEFPQIHIIGLSMNRDEETEQAMMSAGASAYFPKDWAANEIYNAIKELVSSNDD